MSKLKKFIITICFGMLFSAIYPPTSAQNASTVAVKNSGNFVKWQMLGGKDNEFFFVIPEGSSIFSDKNYYLDSDYMSEIDSEKTLVRTINNTVLLITLFEGNGKTIKNKLVANFNKLKPSDSIPKKIRSIFPTSDEENYLKMKEGEINGFGFSEISQNTADCSAKIQIYWNKNHVYYLQSLSHNETDPIVKNFFENVRLVNKNKVLSPNLNSKTEDFVTAKLILPSPIREEVNSASEIVDFDKVEKKAVIGYIPPLPRLSELDRKLDRKYNPVKMKVLFLADGTIGDVKFITKLSKAFEMEVLRSVKATKFLPAKVKEKPVSFYSEMTYAYYF